MNCKDCDEDPGSCQRYDTSCKHQNRPKRRCIERTVYHHPLFDQVDATAATDGLTTIHILNDECLDMILSHDFKTVEIFRLSLVCRRWYNLCMQKISRIKSFSVRHLGEQIYGEDYEWDKKVVGIYSVMSVLSLNCGCLTSMSFTDVEGLNASSLSLLCDFLPNLVKLALKGKFLFDERTMTVLSEKLSPKLEGLALYGEYINNNKIISSVLKNARRLLHLSLSTYDYGHGDIAPSHVDRYQEGGSCIPEVLSPANPMTSISFELSKLHPSVLEFIIKKFGATLDYLKLSRNDPESLNNIDMESLPMLNNMEIFLAHMEEDFPSPKLNTYSAQLLSVLKLMPNLKVLDLTWNCHIIFSGYDVVHILSNHCLLLEELHLSNCWIPAEKLENLRKLELLKRLRLDHYLICDINESEDVPEHDLVLSMRCIAAKVLPSLEYLEYVTMKDNRTKLEVDDIVLFIANAGPNFKGLVLVNPDSYSDSEVRYDFLEDVFRKCNSLSRSEPIAIKVDLYGFHNSSCKNSCKTSCTCEEDRSCKNSCTCEEDRSSFYNEISPKFLRILGGDSFYSFEDHFAVDEFGNLGSLCIYGEYIEVPRKFDIGTVIF